jgi:hypothetical protein
VITVRIAKTLYLCTVVSIGFAAILASTPGPRGQTGNGLPAAQTPMYLAVAAPFIDDSGNKTWQTIGAWQPGQYVVLPLKIVPEIRVYFSAPYPSKFHMTTSALIQVPTTTPGSGGAMNQSLDLAEYDGSQQGPTTGYFQLINVDPQANPPKWEYTIRIPDAFEALTTITVAISNISENPIYTGAQQESDPMQFSLGDGGTDVNVGVFVPLDPGLDMVTSDPPGIDCRSSCTFRYIGWSSVELTAKPGYFYFEGWSGDCSGTQTCTLKLDGNAKSVVATFMPAVPSCNPADPECQ